MAARPGAERGVLASRLVRILAGLVLALGACGGKPAAAPLANTFTSSLTFVELRGYIGPQLFEKLHADGTIEFAFRPGEWQPVGRITESGVAFRADGTRFGFLASDGTFRLASGEASTWKLVGETLLFRTTPLPGERPKVLSLTIDAGGMMRGFEDPAPPYRFEGLTDAGSRRAALFMYAFVLTGRY